MIEEISSGNPTGERIARLEATIEGLKQDASAQRTQLHNINNSQMRLEIVNEQQTKTLTAISSQMDQVKSRLEELPDASRITELESKVATLIGIGQMGRGAWWVLAGGVGIVGTIIAAVTWVSAHIRMVQ